MLTHEWLEGLLEPSFNVYLLGLVVLILAGGVAASFFERPWRKARAPEGQGSWAREEI